MLERQLTHKWSKLFFRCFLDLGSSFLPDSSNESYTTRYFTLYVYTFICCLSILLQCSSVRTRTFSYSRHTTPLPPQYLKFLDHRKYSIKFNELINFKMHGINNRDPSTFKIPHYRKSLHKLETTILYIFMINCFSINLFLKVSNFHLQFKQDFSLSLFTSQLKSP